MALIKSIHVWLKTREEKTIIAERKELKVSFETKSGDKFTIDATNLDEFDEVLDKTLLILDKTKANG